MRVVDLAQDRDGGVEMVDRRALVARVGEGQGEVVEGHRLGARVSGRVRELERFPVSLDGGRGISLAPQLDAARVEAAYLLALTAPLPPLGGAAAKAVDRPARSRPRGGLHSARRLAKRASPSAQLP